MLSSFLNPFIEHRGLGDLLSKGSGKGGVEPLSITSVCCCYIPLPIPQQPCIFLCQPWSLTQRLKLWFLLLTFLAATNSRRSPPGSCFVAPVSALSCTGPAPLPHTWSHGPTVQARHGKGCIWCEEQFLLHDPHDSPLCPVPLLFLPLETASPRSWNLSSPICIPCEISQTSLLWGLPGSGQGERSSRAGHSPGAGTEPSRRREMAVQQNSPTNLW